MVHTQPRSYRDLPDLETAHRLAQIETTLRYEVEARKRIERELHGLRRSRPASDASSIWKVGLAVLVTLLPTLIYLTTGDREKAQIVQRLVPSVAP